MYLITAYFDNKTTDKIQQYINQIAKKTGNTFMLDGNVPPHITLSAFDSDKEGQLTVLLERESRRLQQGMLQWASIGTFFPYVIYLAPVLNEYLHNLSATIYESLLQMDGISIRPYYQPFQWIPHTTVGKKLSSEEMRTAFHVLQHQFGMFSGQVTHIGLAKTNPYENLAVFELREEN